MGSDKLLGEFLRARREVTTPDMWGCCAPVPRRTPGLRREEVAMLAGVSTDYYVRLEQGRERHPSDRVLDALVRVLDLGPDAAAHLYELAHPGSRQRGTTGRTEQVEPGPAAADAQLAAHPGDGVQPLAWTCWPGTRWPRPSTADWNTRTTCSG